MQTAPIHLLLLVNGCCSVLIRCLKILFQNHVVLSSVILGSVIFIFDYTLFSFFTFFVKLFFILSYMGGTIPWSCNSSTHAS